MQHQRGLDLAAMDAVAAFMLGDHTLGIAEAAPLGRDDHHLVAHAQFPGDDAHYVDIAAMGIDDDELANSGFGDFCADCGPGRDQDFRAEGQAARAIDMFVGLADLLGGKDEKVEVVRTLDFEFRQHAVSDRDVGCDRQVRAVLLG